MATPFIATLADVIDGMQDFLAGSGTAAHQQVIRRAIQTAYREIVSARDWKCMIRNGRVPLLAAQTTGTVGYDHADGAYERQVTLVGATWPTWAQDASIRIDDIVCDVEARKSDTVITLDSTMNPGADVAAGTSYTMYPRWYTLPAGFVSLANPTTQGVWTTLREISPAEIFARDREDSTPGEIRWYAIAPAQDLYGSMALYLNPPSNASEPLDFAYKARPRDIRYSGWEANDYAGTISINAGSTTVTGLGTAFAAAHVGSIIRLSSNSTKPTGFEGNNPYVEQRSIAAWTDATHITLDAAVTTTRSAVKYVIADPIDLDVSLYDAFLRCCEKHLAISRDMKNRAAILLAAEDALFRAKGADGRTTGRKIVGGGGGTPLRARDLGIDLVGETVE